MLSVSSDFSEFVNDIVKDQDSFYEICILATLRNIKAFNRVNRKQLQILKIFLEYLEFYIIAF